MFFFFFSIPGYFFSKADPTLLSLLNISCQLQTFYNFVSLLATVQDLCNVSTRV